MAIFIITHLLLSTITATITNNQCARQVRDTLVELQRWLRGRVE